MSVGPISLFTFPRDLHGGNELFIDRVIVRLGSKVNVIKLHPYLNEQISYYEDCNSGMILEIAFTNAMETRNAKEEKFDDLH